MSTHSILPSEIHRKMGFHEKTFPVMIGFVPEYNIEQMDETKTTLIGSQQL